MARLGVPLARAGEKAARSGDPASPFDEKGICRQALDVRSQKLHTPLLGWGFSWRNTARNAAGFRGGATLP